MSQGSRGALLILTGLLTGCAGVPGPDQKVETSRIVQAAPADLAPQIVDFLESQRIEVTRADPQAGLVRGEQRPLERPQWSDCEPFYVRDTEGERRRRAEVLGRRLELEVMLDRLGGQQTLVSVEPAFVGTFHNSFTNLDFEARCDSTRQLERALLEALTPVRTTT